jgi:hypothetical protein
MSRQDLGLVTRLEMMVVMTSLNLREKRPRGQKGAAWCVVWGIQKGVSKESVEGFKGG